MRCPDLGWKVHEQEPTHVYTCTCMLHVLVESPSIALFMYMYMYRGRAVSILPQWKYIQPCTVKTMVQLTCTIVNCCGSRGVSVDNTVQTPPIIVVCTMARGGAWYIYII